MRIKNLFFLFVIVILVSIAVSVLLIQKTSLYSYKRLKIDFTIGDHLGFNTDQDALHFGTLQQGNRGFREFDIKNMDCNKCKVSLISNLDWISLSDNDFILNKNQGKTITAYLTIPSAAKDGKYEGYLDIYLWRVL